MVGIQYLVLSMFMALCGGAFMVLMRMNLAWPGIKWPLLGALFPHAMQSGIMKPEFYLALVTMHGTIMMFFVISLALVSGFGNFIIPLQIGARGHGVPVAEHALVLDGGGRLRACCWRASRWRAARRPRAGPPIRRSARCAAPCPDRSGARRCGSSRMALFMISFTMGGVNFITTILDERVKGMTLFRMPLTVVELPGLFRARPAGVPRAVRRRHPAALRPPFRHQLLSAERPLLRQETAPNEGGTPLLWQHLFWFLGPPRGLRAGHARAGASCWT